MKPHSTVEHVIRRFLPTGWHRFLVGRSERAGPAQVILRGVFGALTGSVMFMGVAHSLPLTLHLKLAMGCVFVVLCLVGGAVSSSFRCSVVLMFPSMLGSRGRAYLMLVILSVLYSGPVSNIQQNIQAAAETLSCNLDLQLHNSKLLWRDAVRPFLMVAQEVTKGEAKFQSEALKARTEFQLIQDQVVRQYGYDSLKAKDGGNLTQEQFAIKTMSQCDSIVNQGIQRCADWFSLKWRECMTVIPVPVINHILCVPMKFHFLCDVMRVMTPWCRQHIPVEGNFGRLFDRLNHSVDLLAREFSTSLVLEELQQDMLEGQILDQEFTHSIQSSFQRLTVWMGRLLDILNLLMSFTFITVFTQSLGYTREFRGNIYFDNMYITTYFKTIDSRRKTLGKRCLLPLSAHDRQKFVDPWSPRIHPEEVQQVLSGVLQVLCVLVVCVVLLTMDWSVVHVLDIVSRHTQTQFNFTSSHQVDIKVDGESMMAHLLRKTVEAFNSSSKVHIITDNRRRVHDSALLPSRQRICQLCLLRPAGGALQLPAGLFQPSPQGHRRLLPPQGIPGHTHLTTPMLAGDVTSLCPPFLYAVIVFLLLVIVAFLSRYCHVVVVVLSCCVAEGEDTSVIFVQRHSAQTNSIMHTHSAYQYKGVGLFLHVHSCVSSAT
ncbi:E3 ubiquitin-protein ligase DCST1 isoform X3 [Dunckerocampus dactyliophorus]|uniref:E3 ubiquitin-protein ligase DCST1 isoform X3 n=1 Tax=Dunckerocampus dactyliophorus TaxID=161453 RepID=UPI002405B886|nr:E3 ubiquitin-protein ligase DCST1 isoform X3 [Dunckerocampus dactyliophorus]